MVNKFNYIFGYTILQIAIFKVKYSSSFKEKYSNIEIQISKSLSNDNQISDSLLHSIIRIEDKRFYNHLGVDFYSILRAIKNYFLKNRLEGASTIEQQLTRTISDEREIKFKRKVCEILISSLVNMRFTKDEILNSYCNKYLFENCIGIQNFCEEEFYDINNLTTYEVAQIVARFKYPMLDKNNYLRFLKRVRIIELQYLSQNQIIKSRENSNQKRYFNDRVIRQLSRQEGLPKMRILN